MADNDNDASSARSRRTIRSFVIRRGRSTAAQERALEQLWPRYGVPFSNQSLDLTTLFGRAAPTMIEIGFGAGEALLSFAQAHPEMNCLGIEVHPPGVGHLMLGLDAANATNVRISMHDAVEVLEQQIPPGSLALAHVFFPDPWPKKRHHKRRIIKPTFVSLLARALHPNGTLRLATDWEHYAMHMRDVLDASPEFSNRAGEQGFVDRPSERPLTRFERRGHRLGHVMWDLEYERK
jgi:tRNA (guanine-N7-)-methyltransferase